MIKRRLTLCLILSLLVLAGCSSVKTYQSTPDNNVEVITKVDSGSIFSSTKATMFVYTVAEECKFQMEGKVKLDEERKVIGLPTDRMSYLEIVFQHSTLGQSTGSTRIESAISPKKDANYGVEVSYGKGYFDLYMIEKSGDSSEREIDKKYIKAC